MAVEPYSSVYECFESIRRTLEAEGLPVSVGGQLQSGDPDKLPELYHRVSGILDKEQRIHHGVVIDTETPHGLGGLDSPELIGRQWPPSPSSSRVGGRRSSC